MTATAADVIVVGAGFAGLTAAYRLTAAGFQVTVLEAGDRVGGRVLSRTLDNGTVVELGGEWIAPTHGKVAGLAAELGLELVPVGIDFGFRDPIGGPSISRTSHMRLAAAVLAEARRMPSAARTAAEVLDAVSIEPAAMAVLRNRLEGSAAVPLDHVGVHEILGSFGVGARGGLRFAAGNAELAIRLASRAGEVRLATPVVACDPIPAGASVTLRHGESLQASVVVLAVPLPMLATFRLPPQVAAAVASLEFGTAAKWAVATVAAPPLASRQDPTLPMWFWTGAGADGEARCAVTSFAGGTASVAAVSRDWAARAQRAFPEAVLSGQPVVVDWGRDPLFAGCYSALPPGAAAALDAFTTPWGAVVFAGEHVTAAGSMDGAVASGERAAVLARGLLAG